MSTRARAKGNVAALHGFLLAASILKLSQISPCEAWLSNSEVWDGLLMEDQPAANFGKNLHQRKLVLKMNLFFPPEGWDDELCTVPQFEVSPGENAIDGGESISTRQLHRHRHVQTLAETKLVSTETDGSNSNNNDNNNNDNNKLFNHGRNLYDQVAKLQEDKHRNRIALLLPRSNLCSAHTQALNALELDARFYAEANNVDASTRDRNAINGPPKIDFIILVNQEDAQNAEALSKHDNEEDVDLYIAAITKQDGDAIENHFEKKREDVSPHLESNAFLPLDDPGRRPDFWLYGVVYTVDKPAGMNSHSMIHGQLVFVFFFMVVMFPVTRMIMYFCTHYRFHWRRNENGRITGFGWRRRMTRTDVSRWMNLIGNIPAFLRPNISVLTEEEVQSLPTIDYGKDDVDDIVQKHLSIAKPGSGSGSSQSDSSNVGIGGDKDDQDDDEHDQENSGKEFIKAAYSSCTTCSICICDFEEGEELRLLPRCGHIFHTDCILPWLTEKKNSCPLCQRQVLVRNDSDVMRFSRERTNMSTRSLMNVSSLRARSASHEDADYNL